MTDVLERQRRAQEVARMCGAARAEALHKEAGDEIARLRAENERLKRAMQAASLKAREATSRHTRSRNAVTAKAAADMLDAALAQSQGQEAKDGD